MMPSASGSISTSSLAAMLPRWLHQHVGLDAAQIEALAARQHRHRDLADFGGGEDEFGVRRRLLQRLQEGVEGRGRQHVDFVDDVDLVARAGRRVAHAVIDLPDVVDAGVGGGVHLQHVHVPAFHDRLAMHAGAGHVDGRRLHRAVRRLVVQGARQNPRGGGLADAADAGEDPGLRNPPGLERVRQRPHHGVLADQMLETVGAIFARQHPIGLGRGCSDSRVAAAPSAKPGCSAAGSVGGVAGWPASVIDRSARGCLSEPVCGNALALSSSRFQACAFRPSWLRGWTAGARSGSKRASHSSIDGALNSLEKTGRRLTSDPIRTSLGLLPSGPDPVGEWLVHRQSPGAYLEPNATECKRGGGGCGRAKARADPTAWGRKTSSPAPLDDLDLP